MTVGLPGFNETQERLIVALTSGMELEAASECVGLPIEEAKSWLMEPRFQRALAQVDKNVKAQRRFTKDSAHDMYMKAFNIAEDSLSMVKATDALVKLHNLVPQQAATQVMVNVDARNGRYEALSNSELEKIIDEESGNVVE